MSVHVFSSLLENQRAVIYPDRTVLIAGGTSPPSVRYLVHGAVELVVADGVAKGFVAAVLSAPDLLGIEAVLADRPQALTVRALGPVSCIEVQSEAVTTLMRQQRQAMKALVTAANEREHKIVMSLATSLLSADDRLSHLLTEYGRHAARLQGNGSKLLVRRTQEELSVASGLTLRHVNRLLQRWRRSGRLHREDGVFVLPHAQSLHGVAELESA